MPARLQDEVQSRLDALIQQGHSLVNSYLIEEEGWNPESPRDEYELRQFLVAGAAEISRVAGRECEYLRQLPPPPGADVQVKLNPVLAEATLGALSALRDAVAGGHLEQLAAKVRAAVHDDMLQQAAELFEGNYHVAAMVLIGGVLENRLRYLCQARNLAPARPALSGYNDALRDQAYSQGTWREVQVIGDRRNDAAHGRFGLVQPDAVGRALDFVRQFLAQHEA